MVPDELGGRVMSLNVLLIGGTTPIGGFLIGGMSNSLGVPVALVTCAIFYERTSAFKQTGPLSANPE